MANKRKQNDEKQWENGFSGHAKAQIIRFSRLSFEEKLRWLDEMQKMILDVRPAGSRDTPREQALPGESHDGDS